MTSPPDTSACPTPTGTRWAASWPRAPRIVAESLLAVSDPLRTALTAGPQSSGADAARALARSLAPAEAAAALPSWLLPGQARSFRRVLAALERHRGALLADPVGSGKTFVALAVAAALQGRRVTGCLVPATLAAQWRTVAERLNVRVEVGTHQQASRGRLPAGTAGLVIIDECHHFRNPLTRRYAHAAPWLVGRPVLLLSATPVVNRLADLAHQLLLGVRDDALLGEGVVSIRATLASNTGLPALGHLVVEDTRSAGPRPERSVAVSTADAEEARLAGRGLAALARLRLSRHSPTAALVRDVLHRALASSPAALAAALRRYRTLLLHAHDARRAGRALTRAELREFAGELDDQLVLWELCADGGSPVELALDDLEVLDVVLGQVAAAAAAEDPKVERLRSILADGRPTLVFVTHRETVRHLRDRLAPPPVAWCAGGRAGLGRSLAPRAVVLEWFREPGEPAVGPGMTPRCLVVTDVAAEGLDLRRAARVVHYDLPWTPMRLEQREGRAVRLGSTHERIDVIRFVPPPAIDAALGMSRRLENKAGLPARAGLGADGIRLWRWRSQVADRLAGGPEALRPGATAVVPGAVERGLLAGFELLARGGTRAEPLSAAVGWLGGDGRWNEAAQVVIDRLLEAARSQALVAAPASAVRAALDRLAGPIRQRLAVAGARRWTTADPDPAARRLAARFGSAISEAARGRDQSQLARLERALAFTAGGHTAGEALLVRRLADADERELDRWTARLPPPAARWEVIEVRLTGLVLFER